MPFAAMPPDSPLTLRRAPAAPMVDPSVTHRAASAERIVESSDGDGFVIVDRKTASPIVPPAPVVVLGAHIRIDAALVRDDARRVGSVRR